LVHEEDAPKYHRAIWEMREQQPGGGVAVLAHLAAAGPYPTAQADPSCCSGDRHRGQRLNDGACDVASVQRAAL